MELQRYRIEVGRMHGVEPKHIVGAISNEAQIRGQGIGQIKIYDDHSMVDLPKDMPNHILTHLQSVWVCGQKLRISLSSNSSGSGPGQSPKRKTFGKGGERRFTPGGSKRPPSRRGPKR
jgi:ATP-dependent RNA helicase DeaD